MKPKKCISYSEMTLFYKDKDEYQLRYLLGIPFEPTKPMRYGSIIHDRLAGKIDNEEMEKQILRIGFMPDKVRIAKELLKNCEPATEKKLFAEVDGIKIMGILDGFDEKEKRVIEHKTRSGNWSQAEADTHDQLDFYALCVQLNYDGLPQIQLNSLNTLNGKVLKFETRRTQEQINLMKSKIKKFKEDLISLNWFDKRISTYQK